MEDELERLLRARRAMRDEERRDQEGIERERGERLRSRLQMLSTSAGDVLVQALGTVLGGVILALIASAIGLLQTPDGLRVGGAVFAVAAVAAAIVLMGLSDQRDRDWEARRDRLADRESEFEAAIEAEIQRRDGGPHYG